MKNIETQKARIVKLIEDRDDLLKLLDDLPEIWAREIPSVIEKNMSYVVEAQVKNNPDAVKEMDRDNIKSMKKDIQAIKDGLPEMCKITGDFPHLNGSLSGTSSKAELKAKIKTISLDFFTPAVSRAMGPFEKLINESELSKNSSHHWFGEKGARSMAKMPSAFEKYIVAWESYFEVVGNIKIAENSLHLLEAENHWSTS